MFHSQPPALPCADTLDGIEVAGMALLAEDNFQRYEVSAYARPNKQSVHNTNYWQFGDYLGIGAGAHGKLSVPSRGEIIRRRKTRTPGDYLTQPSKTIETRVPLSQQAFEFMLNALRLREGVPKALFTDRTGLSANAIEDTLQTLIDRGLMLPGEVLATSELGYRFLDDVVAAFQPEATSQS